MQRQKSAERKITVGKALKAVRDFFWTDMTDMTEQIERRGARKFVVETCPKYFENIEPEEVEKAVSKMNNILKNNIEQNKAREISKYILEYLIERYPHIHAKYPFVDPRF